MGRSGRDRAGRRGGKGFEGRGVRGSYDDRWIPNNRYCDPERDIRDLYDEFQDPAGDEYVWPEFESEDED